MYWPIGTPRIHATSSSRSPTFKFLVSNDGLKSPSETDPRSPPLGSASLNAPSSAVLDDGDLLPPPTPMTPGTPGIQPVEHGDEIPSPSDASSPATEAPSIPVKDPILALRVSRAGHIFTVITKTSITVWQTKVRNGTRFREGRIC
jgi:hypothetical protein